VIKSKNGNLHSQTAKTLGTDYTFYWIPEMVTELECQSAPLPELAFTPQLESKFQILPGTAARSGVNAKVCPGATKFFQDIIEISAVVVKQNGNY